MWYIVVILYLYLVTMCMQVFIVYELIISVCVCMYIFECVCLIMYISVCVRLSVCTMHCDCRTVQIIHMLS